MRPGGAGGGGRGEGGEGGGEGVRTRYIMEFIDMCIKLFNGTARSAHSYKVARGDVPSSAYFRVLHNFALLGQAEVNVFH